MRECRQWQPHAPPQQPPPLFPAADPPALARPPTEIVDSSLTVSSWPCGQVHGADDSLIGRVRSKVSPQALQRYSYRGTAPILLPPGTLTRAHHRPTLPSRPR